MDGLMLTKGFPSPGLAVGRDPVARHHHSSMKAAALAPRAAVASGGGAVESSSAAAAGARQPYVFPLLLTRLWPGGSGAAAAKGDEGIAGSEKAELAEAQEEEPVVTGAERRGDNWVLKILRVRSMWVEREADRNAIAAAAEDGDRCVGCSAAVDYCSEVCAVAGEEEEEEATAAAEEMVFDRESFSRLLRRVSMAETEVYSKMAYLGSLAYIVSKIKSNKNLLRRYGLRFVTSSLEKKHKSANSNEEQEEPSRRQEEGNREENSIGISASAAYQIVASAASYLQSQTTAILPGVNTTNRASEAQMQEASFVATTDSVTAVVAGNEEMKQAMAEDLNSASSLPCEWYICDDDKNATRYFVIQGSETIASWQTNLLFEPVRFEGLDVPVHRGIYEAAKGMHQQMLPEIRAHLKSHGDSATLRFTGHSLGGSLAVLVNLMLLIRGEAPASSLLPVITFGAPSIMCGGDALLRRLGLPKHHVQAVAMHRDIVPRAFSCNYPDHVAEILKALNWNFRNHSCLKNQKLLYTPMGKLLILQPEEEFSPCHHLLPPGSGLYAVGDSLGDDSGKTLQAATLAFLNSPHPLEILSDRSAYGSEGTVYRDHDTNSYLRSVRRVLLAQRKRIRRLQREQRRRKNRRVLEAPEHGRRVTGGALHRFGFFAGVVGGGTRTLERFARLVASQHVRTLVVVLFFPARDLLLGALSGGGGGWS